MSRDLDTSRLRRALSLSKLGARLALKQGQKLLARDPSAVHRELARAMVEELGGLKGLPMKIGQILSYMDGLVPDEHAAIYRDILGELRTQSRPLATEACRQVFEDELGAPPEELFDELEPTPIASASIGQVHRARYRGQEVAVKVQYPGIAEATTSDLSNLDALVAVMRRIMPTIDTRQMIEDFRVRLVEECDYEAEADYQRRFARIYEGDADLVVPEVIDERSTKRVLTTRFVRGESLETFAAGASDEERQRASRALFRFAFGSLLGHGLFHSDPHPGNLLFRADGTARLAVLDYGCVQPIDAQTRRDIGVLLGAAMGGEQLSDHVARALGLAEMDDATRDAVARVTSKVLAPIIEPQPYTFTRSFAAEISREVVEAKQKLAARFLTRRGGFVARRNGVMFVVRNLFGLASIWGTLGARGDYRALTRELIDASEPAAEQLSPGQPGQ